LFQLPVLEPHGFIACNEQLLFGFHGLVEENARVRKPD
jgi:hypothetical protein